MSDYFLSSSRLGFRWWQPSDNDLAQQLWGDPEVTKMFVKAALSPQEVQQRLERELANRDAHGVQYWQLFTLSDGDFVGACGLRPHKDDVYEFGFHLRPNHWGHGFATEAGKTVIEHAFSRLGKRAIFAGHHPKNRASRNALLKLGFIGAQAQYFEPTGLHHPAYFIYNYEPKFSTRPATPHDAVALASVHRASILKTFGESLPQYANSRTLDEFEQVWQKRVDDPSCVTNLLLRGEQIVGFVSAAPSTDDDADGSFGDVDRIYLHPAVWGKRYGETLLQWCETNLAQRGFPKAKLWVFEANERARRFYEKHGYTLDGKTKEAHNARLLRYQKPLLNPAKH